MSIAPTPLAFGPGLPQPTKSGRSSAIVRLRQAHRCQWLARECSSFTITLFDVDTWLIAGGGAGRLGLSVRDPHSHSGGRLAAQPAAMTERGTPYVWRRGRSGSRVTPRILSASHLFHIKANPRNTRRGNGAGSQTHRQKSQPRRWTVTSTSPHSSVPELEGERTAPPQRRQIPKVKCDVM